MDGGRNCKRIFGLEKGVSSAPGQDGEFAPGEPIVAKGLIGPGVLSANPRAVLTGRPIVWNGSCSHYGKGIPVALSNLSKGLIVGVA